MTERDGALGRALHAAVVALVTFVGVATGASAAPHGGDVAAPFSLPSARGGSVSLAQYRGKPVYVNFFASWCGPCNNEAPAVADLYKKYRRAGLAVVGVDEQEDRAKALEFASKFHWPFAIALDDGTMGKAYGAFALPVHVFIDRHGKIGTYRLGEMSRDEVDAAIKKLL
ncbi:MAG: hypothetical protein NVSMB59_05600 [Vulcanimicrobiaceae bacterium]